MLPIAIRRRRSSVIMLWRIHGKCWGESIQNMFQSYIIINEYFESTQNLKWWAKGRSGGRFQARELLKVSLNPYLEIEAKIGFDGRFRAKLNSQVIFKNYS